MGNEFLTSNAQYGELQVLLDGKYAQKYPGGGWVFFEIFEKYVVLFYQKNQKILWKRDGVGVFQYDCKKYHGNFPYLIRGGGLAGKF